MAGDYLIGTWLVNGRRKDISGIYRVLDIIQDHLIVEWHDVKQDTVMTCSIFLKELDNMFICFTEKEALEYYKALLVANNGSG
jgi:Fe2+ or Zn2+ uptake regulation protein